MLSLALLLGTLFESPKPAQPSPLHVTCPTSPATFGTLPALGTCAALEIAGHIDSGSVALDPAFDVDVAPSALARPGHGDAVLAGYAADGRTVFAQSFSADGAFHLYVPLSRTLAQSVARLELVASGSTVDVTATAHREPQAETLSLDAGHYLLAWNAREFPSVRVSTATAAPILLSEGKSTYEQRTLDGTARTIVVEFSDGVRSTTRPFRIFGR
jgi:hypothetical protein